MVIYDAMQNGEGAGIHHCGGLPRKVWAPVLLSSGENHRYALPRTPFMHPAERRRPGVH